jgi:hypothetical protein
VKEWRWVVKATVNDWRWRSGRSVGLKRERRDGGLRERWKRQKRVLERGWVVKTTANEWRWCFRKEARIRKGGDVMVAVEEDARERVGG